MTTPAGYAWLISGCGSANGSPTPTTSPPAGASTYVEAIAAPEPGRAYPRCTGGRRAGPPQDWDGPADYLDRTQPYRVFDAIVRAAEILREILDADPDTTLAAALGDDHYDELRRLAPLLGLDRFDRRALNQTLANLATAERTPA